MNNQRLRNLTTGILHTKTYMYKLIVIANLLLLLTGCDDDIETYSKHGTLHKLPVTIIANNTNGLILRDGIGEITYYDKDYNFAKIIFAEGLKPGTVLSNITNY